MKKISNDFWTDEKTIFYQNYAMKKPKAIPEVDAETFEVHSCYLASDKHRIYAQSTMREGLQIFIPEDMESIIFFPEKLTESTFVDKYNLYIYNAHFITYSNIADDKEADLIAWLKTNYPKKSAWWNNSKDFYKNLEYIEYSFFTDSLGRIYYKFKADHLYDYPIYNVCNVDFYLQLKNTDAKTFIPLNDIYSKDQNKVFFYSRLIPADPTTFEVIDNLFAKDKDGIFYNGRRVKIDDFQTFELINSSKKSEFHFAKDQNKVYASSNGKIDTFSGYADLLLPLKNSDPSTFIEINDVWTKDENNVYWFGKIYKKADAETFKLISEPPLTEVDYASDKNYVYINNGQTLKKGLDGGSFNIINEYWAKDNFVVYCLPNGRIMKSIDVNTFKVIDGSSKAEDDNYFYEYADYSVRKEKK